MSIVIPDDEAKVIAATLKAQLSTVDGVYIKYYCPAQYDSIKSFIDRVEGHNA